MATKKTCLADRYPTRLSNDATPVDRLDPVIWSGPTGTVEPLSPHQLTEYDMKGFVTIPRFLTDEETRLCVTELDRMAADPTIRADERTIIENDSQQVRSIFDVIDLSEPIRRIIETDRVTGAAERVLGSKVYVHQSRINCKPGFEGGGFYWHSDFETWHAEDGMPSPRAMSISIALTDNYVHNGCLMIMPGSHRTYVPCRGRTPENYHAISLTGQSQQIGMPDKKYLAELVAECGIETITGPGGSATLFDSNCMHGSANNITPYPRSNIFVVFNSVENRLTEPFAAPVSRPTYMAART